MIYIFKVKLSHNKRTWRTIAINENQTLDTLHEAIFHAFDRYDAHLYSFYMTNGAKRQDRFRSCPEYTDPNAIQNDGGLFGFRTQPKNAARTKIKDLNLSIKDKFEYLFDFGDNWLHEIVLEEISEPESKTKYPKILKVNGESPEQYPDYDDEYEDEEYD